MKHTDSVVSGIPGLVRPTSLKFSPLFLSALRKTSSRSHITRVVPLPHSGNESDDICQDTTIFQSRFQSCPVQHVTWHSRSFCSHAQVIRLVSSWSYEQDLDSTLEMCQSATVWHRKGNQEPQPDMHFAIAKKPLRWLRLKGGCTYRFSTQHIAAWSWSP